MNPKKVIVIGAGYTGMTAAYRLLKSGHAVTLVEQSRHLGGMAATVPYQGTQLEIFYHHWFTSDRAILDLLNEIGLGDKLHRYQSKMGFFTEGRIWNFDTPKALLQFKPMSFFSRIRFGAGTLWLRDFVKDWKKLEGRTAIEALPKYVGKEATKVIWEPLLRGKFGPWYRDVSMVWLWGKIMLRGSSRSKGTAKEELLYPQGSFHAVTQRLAERIQAMGGNILTGVGVKRVLSKRGQSGEIVRGIETEKEILEAEAVLHTGASHILCELAPQLDASWKERVSNLKHAAAVCMLLTLNRSFSSIYWLNIGDLSIPFNALIEQTNLVPKDLYGGKVPLYVSNYLMVEDPHYSMETGELFREYLPHLKKIRPDFDESWVDEIQVYRTRYAQPIIPCHYSKMIPPFETPLKGLYMANLAQIYPEDRGTNYAVDLGNRVSQEISRKLEERDSASDV